MSRLEHQKASVGSTPTQQRVRACNASLASIQAGLKPVRQLNSNDDAGTAYFVFPNGQYRRQISQGHSRAERFFRRKARAARRDAVKLNLPLSSR